VAAWRDIGRIVADPIMAALPCHGFRWESEYLSCGIWAIAFLVTPLYSLVYPKDTRHLHIQMQQRYEMIASGIKEEQKAATNRRCLEHKTKQDPASSSTFR